MDRKGSGRKRPGERVEPRVIKPSTAAPDLAERELESVSRDVNAEAFGMSSVDVHGDVVLDTGWYVDGSVEVRVTVLGGVSDPHRRSWLERFVQQG